TCLGCAARPTVGNPITKGFTSHSGGLPDFARERHRFARMQGRTCHSLPLLTLFGQSGSAWRARAIEIISTSPDAINASRPSGSLRRPDAMAAAPIVVRVAI